MWDYLIARLFLILLQEYRSKMINTQRQHYLKLCLLEQEHIYREMRIDTLSMSLCSVQYLMDIYLLGTE